METYILVLKSCDTWTQNVFENKSFYLTDKKKRNFSSFLTSQSDFVLLYKNVLSDEASLPSFCLTAESVTSRDSVLHSSTWSKACLAL